MPEIRDIYDCSDGSEDRNQWQSILYNKLVEKLGLDNSEGLPGAAVQYANALHQLRSGTGRQALTFLAVYGWIVSELGPPTFRVDDDELYMRFGRASTPRYQNLYVAAFNWVSHQPDRHIWAWRIHRVVQRLIDSGLDSSNGAFEHRTGDLDFESLWSYVAQGETGLLPSGFPRDPTDAIEQVFSVARPVQTPAPPKTPDLEFPELYVDPVNASTPEETEAIRSGNAKRQQLYRAVRYLLERDFGVMEESLPIQALDFVNEAEIDTTGTLTPPDAFRLIGVIGTVLASGLDDPLLNRPREAHWPDDIVARDGDQMPPMRIARRFADGVVAAMQEFTSRAPLYKQTQKLLAKEGQRLNGAP